MTESLPSLHLMHVMACIRDVVRHDTSLHVLQQLLMMMGLQQQVLINCSRSRGERRKGKERSKKRVRKQAG